MRYRLDNSVAPIKTFSSAAIKVYTVYLFYNLSISNSRLPLLPINHKPPHSFATGLKPTCFTIFPPYTLFLPQEAASTVICDPDHIFSASEVKTLWLYTNMFIIIIIIIIVVVVVVVSSFLFRFLWFFVAD